VTREGVGLSGADHAQRREEFRYVAHARFELFRCLIFGFVRRKKMRIFFQCRAAPRGVGQNCIELFPQRTLSDYGGPARERLLALLHGRPALRSTLLARYHDFAAIRH